MALTNRFQLQEDLANAVLENMTNRQLEDFAYNALLENYDRLSEKEFIALVKLYHPEILEQTA